MDSSLRSLAADWILPVAGPPIRDGVLRIRGGRVEAVGPRGQVAPAARHEELGPAAVLPGFVNAHCHLELSTLRGKLPRHRPMTQWLFALMQRALRGQIDYEAGAALGAAELIRHGCTTVGDISHDNGVWPVLEPLPLRKVCFAEVTGIGPRRAGALERLEQSLIAVRPGERLRFGVSPHAPYSTAEEVYVRAIDFAHQRGLPVATHLAETEQERIFLRDGAGKFFDFLAHLGLIDLSVTVHHATPLQFAQRVGLLDPQMDPPALLVHAHAIGEKDLDLLADSRASVAYCPRSTAFFGRSGHRYAEMLARGVNVAVGTDSLASNASLDMLAELRAIRADGQVDADTILRMGTLNGAAALGMADEVGSLEPGRAADWIAIPCAAEADPAEAILSGTARVTRVTIGGEDVGAAD